MFSLHFFLQVCASEKARVDACLIDRMVEYCQCDIRKTIMNLQFWCQSQNSLTGNYNSIHMISH